MSKAKTGIGRKIGRIVSAPFRWAGKQVEKELRMQDAQDKRNKQRSQQILQDWYGR